MGRTAPVEETSRISGFGTFGASTTGKVLRFLLMARLKQTKLTMEGHWEKKTSSPTWKMYLPGN